MQIVGLPVLSAQHRRLPQRAEDLPVRDFIAESAVDVLYKAVLPRRARLRLS